MGLNSINLFHFKRIEYFFLFLHIYPVSNWTTTVSSLVAQLAKNLPAMQETWVRSLGWEDPLEKGMTTHSSILAWRIPLDRGAWQATVHRVAKSRTWLSNTCTPPDLSTHLPIRLISCELLAPASLMEDTRGDAGVRMGLGTCASKLT